VRWTPGRRSENLEDRRAETGRRFPFPMGRGRIPMGGAPRMSLGGLLLLLLLLFLFRGNLLGDVGGGQVGVPTPLPGEAGSPFEPGPGVGGSGFDPATASPEEERTVDFVSFVLDDLQETWARLLPGYRDAKLVLFRDAVRSECGVAAAQMGPFYCPLDEKVYIDLAFYEELRRRFGAPGDFAQAYVLAHEIGHHVQKLLGIEPQVRSAQQGRPDLANDLSVRMELQADCLAGVWGHSTARRDLLEEGDVEEGLNAAAAIGDDRLQRATQGTVQPESFTHGSSRERVDWLRRGLESGDPDACDTFGSR
jgi:predicted metalloprotease